MIKLQKGGETNMLLASEYVIQDAYGILNETSKQANNLLKAILNFPETIPFPNNENARYRMIDLFAGIGGTRLGFYQTGAVNVVFSSEWDK